MGCSAAGWTAIYLGRSGALWGTIYRAPTRLGGAGCGAMDESGVGGEAEGFEQAGLHLFGERVDFIDAQIVRH